MQNSFRAKFYDKRGLPLTKGHEWFVYVPLKIYHDFPPAERLRSNSYAVFEKDGGALAHQRAKIPAEAVMAVVDDHAAASVVVMLKLDAFLASWYNDTV